MSPTDKNNGNADISFDVREVGRVTAVREFIVRATDMPSCINGQIVEFDQGLRGMVMGFMYRLIRGRLTCC